MTYRVGELCLPDNHTHDKRNDMASASVTTVMSGRERDLARLLSHVRKTPTCWLWQGAFSTQYGEKTYGQSTLDGKKMPAHKVSFLVHGGIVPDGYDVMHACNVKACVNPAHLSAGTRSQNLRDAKRDDPGLWAGERNGNAKLTWDDVDTIRSLAANGHIYKDIGSRYGLSGDYIGLVVRGQKWANDPRKQQEEPNVAA